MNQQNSELRRRPRIITATPGRLVDHLQRQSKLLATDLREFPLKIEMNQPETQLVMLYKDVKLVRPDARLFEAPTGFTRHANIELLMQSAAFKKLVQPGR